MTANPCLCGAIAVGLGLVLSGCTSTNTSPVTANQDTAISEPVVDTGTPQPAGNQTFDATQLAGFIPGKSINFGDGTANYHTDKSYIYRGHGRAWKGVWYLNEDQVCIKFTNGDARCDRYGYDGKKYFIINGKGNRFNIYKFE